jgi:hypothetical protein
MIMIAIDERKLEGYHRHIHSSNLLDTLDRVLEEAAQSIIECNIEGDNDGHVEMTGYGNVGTWEIA